MGLEGDTVRPVIVACCIIFAGLLLSPGCKYLERQKSSAAAATAESRKQVSEDFNEIVDALEARVQELEKQVKELTSRSADGEQAPAQ